MATDERTRVDWAAFKAWLDQNEIRLCKERKTAGQAAEEFRRKSKMTLSAVELRREKPGIGFTGNATKLLNSKQWSMVIRAVRDAKVAIESNEMDAMACVPYLRSRCNAPLNTAVIREAARLAKVKLA